MSDSEHGIVRRTNGPGENSEQFEFHWEWLGKERSFSLRGRCGFRTLLFFFGFLVGSFFVVRPLVHVWLSPSAVSREDVERPTSPTVTRDISAARTNAVSLDLLETDSISLDVEPRVSPRVEPDSKRHTLARRPSLASVPDVVKRTHVEERPLDAPVSP